MSFREKKAWITLCTLLVVFSVYTIVMTRAYHVAEPNFGYLLHLLLLAIVAFGVIEVILLLVARLYSPDDANTPKDEREQLIEYKANRLAYQILLALIAVVTFFMIHLNGDTWGFGNLYLGTLMLAEVVRFGTQIVLYRKG
jgi:hypothetical protein